MATVRGSVAALGHDVDSARLTACKKSLRDGQISARLALAGGNWLVTCAAKVSGTHDTVPDRGRQRVEGDPVT
jgi:hypothetical protein